ncbi:MAG: hypothetical protein OEZ28_08825 [Nitrospinota bacterium]|nr:hypothetical protein [Nitrospinota bacterium]
MDWKKKLAMARRRIRGLSHLRRNPWYVESLTTKRLAAIGAQAIVLDHDGVLGPNRSVAPDEGGLELIKNCVEVFGPGMVFILSNTHSRRQQRREYYSEHQKDVVYLVARPKPDIDGMQQASWASGAPVEKIAMVDDGLLTGALMALESGAMPIYALRRVMDESLLAWGIRLSTTWPQIIVTRILELALLRR